MFLTWALVEVVVAQKVTVSLVDEPSSLQADETVSFAFGGMSYENDLSSRNADKLRGALVDYVAAPHKADGTRWGAAASSAQRPAVDREPNQAIREWVLRMGLGHNRFGPFVEDCASSPTSLGGRVRRSAR